MLPTTLSSTAADTAMPAAEALRLLDDVMSQPGAQAHHYVVVRRMLDDGQSLFAYSLMELQVLTGKSSTTCKAIRHWLAERLPSVWLGQETPGGRDSDPAIPSETGQNSDPSSPFGTCMVHGTIHGVLAVPSHGSESCPLARRLQAIGWGRRHGRQIRDPDELIQVHGTARVREALDRATDPEVKNPAGFVTWFLRSRPTSVAGNTPPADDGPQISAKPEDGPPKDVRFCPTTEAEVTPVADEAASGERLAENDTADLRPVTTWLRQRVPPRSWETWFASLQLRRAGETVVVVLDNPFLMEWVRDEFGSLLSEAVQTCLGDHLALTYRVSP